MTQIQPAKLQHAFGRQDEQFARAFALIESGIREHVAPGAVVAVTHRKKLAAWKPFGRFTYDEGSSPVQPDTIFDLASVTKAVAMTTMAMLLYERGKLDLKARVSNFFRQFHDAGKQDVTVAMLLSHCSGLPPYERLYLRCKTRDELVGAAAASPLAYPPGESSAYSDLGFILLGDILSRLAAEDLASFVTREIFGPLRMTSAQFCPKPQLHSAIPPTQEDREFRHRVIQGEVDDENASVMGGVAGHAGLFANAYALSIFAECLLRGGAPILQAETVRLFTTRRSWPSGNSFALGWDTPSHPSQSGHLLSADAFGHLGYTGTSLWIDPVHQVSIVLLTNRTWPHRQSQAIKQLRPAVHDAIVEALSNP